MAGLDFNSTTESVDVGAATIDDTFVGGGTIMCRINADSYGFGTNFGRLLDKASTTGAALGWALQLDGGSAQIRFEYGWTTTNGNWLTPTNSLLLNTDYHIALAYDDGATGNNPSIYIDGSLQSLTEPSTPAGSAESDAAETLGIGNIVAATYVRGFDGIISDVRCYNRELSAIEIQNIALLQIPYPYDQIAFWDFNEGAKGLGPSGSNSVKDQAPGKSDGTPNSTPLWVESDSNALRRRL